MSPMVRRSLTIEHALLGFLQSGPLHGYQLHQQLSDPAGIGYIWRVKQAQLYALLDKFEQDGYITSTVQQQETRPARRVYTLTAIGQRALEEWLSSPVQTPRQMRQEFQAKLFFVRNQSPTLHLRLFDAQRIACQRWLETHHCQPTSAGDGDESHAFTRLVDRFRTGQVQAMLDWLDQCDSLSE